MRIRKPWRHIDPHGYHACSTPLPPPDRVSSTHQAPTDDDDDPVFRRVSSDSQEPHDHYRIINPPFVDDTNKLTPPHSCVSHNGELCLQKNQRSFDPPPVMRSIINASICSNQDPEILEEESISEEKIRPVSAIHKSTPMDNNRHSSSSSTNCSADISAASSGSSSLPSHGSWCEEEKVFPLKKRRISLERFTSTKESNTVNKLEEKRKIAKMWASSGTETMHGKEMIRDYNEVEINSGQAIEENLMMRCTKVDGARWRCSRRRLEGRSLCKHHFNLQRMHNSRRPRFGCSYRLTNASNAGKDFRASKKRKKVLMISSILDRTVPLLATGDNI